MDTKTLIAEDLLKIQAVFFRPKNPSLGQAALNPPFIAIIDLPSPLPK